jgi:hypothetical protein
MGRFLDLALLVFGLQVASSYGQIDMTVSTPPFTLASPLQRLTA